jgi:serine/threonine protein kinase
MGNDMDAKMLAGGAITPPPTPTHSKTNSASSISWAESLRRGDSTRSTASARRRLPSIDESERPGSTALKTFPHELTDYEMREKLGSGLWSNVFLAEPCLPKLSGPSSSSPDAIRGVGEVTPPITPVKSRTSSLSKAAVPDLPRAYAVKVPNGKSAKKVLQVEAKTLSYLSRFAASDEHVVGFYGMDTRTGALVLKAMDTTLEDWMYHDLNARSEAARAQKLAEVFPQLALDLLNGLTWMRDKACVHADIKPSNVLLSASAPGSALHAVYSDFSSATLSALLTPDGTPAAPLGGGTWDYLDPILVTKASSPALPSADSDLWSLAITLLSLVIGASPFDCATNVFQRREIIKHGTPLSYAAYGDDGPRNLKRIHELSRELGLDMQTWFAKALVKAPAQRVGLAAWKQELEHAVLASRISRI